MKYYPFKDLNINLVMADNNLKAILKMYTDIKYSN